MLTPVAVVAPDSTLLYANAVAARLVDSDASHIIGQNMLSFVHPDDRERVSAELEKILGGATSAGFTQFRLRGKHGKHWRTFDSYAHDLSDDPQVRGVLVSGGDVTEREFLSRALRIQTEGNQLLVHATDEASLIENVCRSIVDLGEYMLAWVGYVEHDATKSVRKVASNGVSQYVDDVHVSWSDDAFGQGPTGTAIRTNTVQVVKDVRRSKRCTPWRRQFEHYGVHTSCSFPLTVRDVTIGALSIYGSDSNAFGPAEIELLSELAGDLAFGIGRLRDAQSLARNETYLREAERLAHVGHWEWDFTSDRFELMADGMYSILGISASQWGGGLEALLSFVAPDDRDAVRTSLDETLEIGSSELLHRVVKPDGEVRFIRMRSEVALGVNGSAERIVGVSLDVTDEMTTKRELNQSQEFLLAITDNMAEGMIATDRDGVITFANAAAERLFRRSSDELLGSTTKAAFSLKSAGENAAPDTPCTLSRVWAGGESLSTDHDTLLRLDGTTVPVAYSASPLRGHGLNGAVIVFDDISERVAEQLRVERQLENLVWVGRIRDALDNGRFVLYAQPIVDLATSAVVQHELLIRMVSPEGDILAPDLFLPTAEEYDLIIEIDRWVIGETARLAAQGHRVEFNLSAKSVADANILSVIRNALEEHGAPPENIVCEITETALMRDVSTAETFVRGLNDLGLKVALDDFGTGYGGFAYLKRLPVSYLKIDREFVRDLEEEMSSRHVISAVVNLAQAFGMTTVAEGAESDASLRVLRELGVDHVQGYVVGRPSLVTEALVTP
ncbi:MAG TPA: EAL domain-containing protein [Acidimicrobiales bacterium]|nr:EAL domain-containing protein [Acidimicrobiales bacterium]